MVKLGTEVRSIISESGDRHKNITRLFMSWETEDEHIIIALKRTRGDNDQFESFLKETIERLRKQLLDHQLTQIQMKKK
jgi:hypothetical protein